MIGLGVLVAAACPVLGQVPPPVAAPATAPSGQQLITLNFPDNLELKVLVEYVSDRLGVNILYDEQAINQRVTLKTPAQVPRESLMGLLESALKMKGLMLVEGEQPGWRRIVQANNLVAAAEPSATSATTQPATDAAANRPSRAVTQVFTLRYADAAKADTAVKPFLTQPGGNSMVLAEQRMLIVTDFASNMARIARLVELVDQPQRQVDVKFLAVRHLEAQQLAQQLTQLLAAKDKQRTTGAANAAAPQVDVSQEPRTNRLVIIGPAEQIDEAIKLVGELDVALDLETRYYALKSASPERIDRLARELLKPTDTARSYSSVIDKEANLLIVTAPATMQKTVADLADNLDVPVTTEQSPVKLYKLLNTTAADVLETIRAIEGQAIATAQSSTNGPTTNPAAASSWPPNPNAGVARPGDLGSALPGHGYRPERGPGDPNGPSAPRVSQPIRTANATVTADANTNSIIVVGSPATQSFYEQMIRSLDKRRPQVLVECTIVTLDTTNERSFGVEIGGSGGIGNSDFVTFSSFGLSTPNPNTGQLTLIPGLGFNGAIINPDVGTIIIRALQTSGHAEVFSAPRILVNDNATGTLSSIAESPFTSVNAGDTVATTSFAGYASAGTSITVTPHISEGDHLQLEYAIALNNFTGEGANGIPPPRQTDAVESQVTIPDGQIIVVGGLNRRNFSKTVATFPILGDIPIIKYAFGNRRKTEGTTTLFVFLRPIILRDDQFADLKYYSKRDAALAKVSDGTPKSEPVLVD